MANLAAIVYCIQSQVPPLSNALDCRVEAIALPLADSDSNQGPPSFIDSIPDDLFVARYTVQDSVFARLRSMILSHRLKSGEKLVQSELAERLGVSRTPIREALYQLSAEGFVSISPHKGASITDFSLEELREIYAVRIPLEGYAAYLAAQNLGDPVLDRLEELVRRMKQMHQMGDRLRLLEVNREFYSVLYQAAAGDGETTIMPVEVCETRFPIRVEQFSFNTAQAGGSDRYRGGYGLIRDYRVLCEEAFLTATFGRFKYPPWGAGGGSEGSPNAVEIFPNGSSSAAVRRGKFARHRLARGDLARLITGSGGGYGAAFERDPELVLADVRAGLLSPARAAEAYGVVLDPDGSDVDRAATASLRGRVHSSER